MSKKLLQNLKLYSLKISIMKKILLLIAAFTALQTSAQNYKPLERVDPPFWWNNLNNKE